MKNIQVAYFSMEFALNSRIPNYAGGLGVLAADMLHSFADTKFSGVGVSLIYHQDENPELGFQPEKFMKRLPETVEVQIEGRTVKVGIFQYDVSGRDGNTVPIYFLTTNLPENQEWDRDLTKHLYASDQYTRLGQEAILGIGGVRMLRKLGYDNIEIFHMNEGHSALLTLELLRECNYHDERVRENCAFTTHTPIEAGHDHFDYRLAHQILGDMLPWHIKKLATEDNLSMTDLAMNLSKKTNSVSERHRRVCEEMFPNQQFENVTNGIHHLTWVSTPMAHLFDRFILEWRDNPQALAQSAVLPNKDVQFAHQENKQELISWINAHPDFFGFSEVQPEDQFDSETLTIAFARRFVPYKRPDLIFHNLDRLRDLGYRNIQMIFGGKCHPDDQFCNWKRGSLKEYAKKLRGQIRIAVLPDYDLDIAKKLTSGADIWLNNPIPPLEASGTSGMKAALNGVLNLSILDGWWREGYAMNPLSGWAFGENSDQLDEKIRDEMDAKELYEQLGKVCASYENKAEWTERMKSAISLAGYFNTERCLQEYQEKMWEGSSQENEAQVPLIRGI